jgi:hypothetical protein
MVSKVSKKDEKIERLANALGHICISWGRLENNLSQFIELLGPLEEGFPSEAITAGMDIRTKIQIIKALAHIRQPSKRWFKRITQILDYIDNDIRVRRNRCIHDAFFTPPGKLIRRMQQIKFERPQSFQFQLVTTRDIPIRITDIEMLAIELDDLVVPLILVFSGVYKKKGTSALPAKFSRRFLRRLRLSSHPRSGRSKQKHPPKSSSG